MRNELIRLVEESAETDANLVFMTGDLGFSVVESLQAKIGQRFVNVGIAEANMATMAGAMAGIGLRPWIYSIVPFITMRCFEQIRNDICYSNRSVRLIGIGAGYSYGSLGPSHHALEDTHIMAALPNMTVVCPGSFDELNQLYALLYDVVGPVYFRIGKGAGPKVKAGALTLNNPISVIHTGNDINLVVSGTLLEEALSASEALQELGVRVNLVSVPIIAPFPQNAVASALCSGPVLCLFEAYAGNPLEQGICRLLVNQGQARVFVSMAASGDFSKRVGDQAYLRHAARINCEAIINTVSKIVKL